MRVCSDEGYVVVKLDDGTVVYSVRASDPTGAPEEAAMLSAAIHACIKEEHEAILESFKQNLNIIEA